MASQAELREQIEYFNGLVFSIQSDIERERAEGDAGAVAASEARLAQAQSQLAQAEAALANITTVPSEEDIQNADNPIQPQRTPTDEEIQNADNPPQIPQTPGNQIPTVTIVGQRTNTQSNAAKDQNTNFKQTADWRVRLGLSPSAKYLYNSENPGILLPLKATQGIIFPYTPTINIVYNANYDAPDITHTNYKLWQYKNSSIDSVNITGEFTAQDTAEASYMVAVIHFLKSVTKMFYGQDKNPINGTPPPLCFLSGYGAFQFDNNPLVITAFNYNLPNDVDYIRAGSSVQASGVNLSAYQLKLNTSVLSNTRLGSAGLSPGGQLKAPQFQNLQNTQATYVPTKMQVSISCYPLMSREAISQDFSLEKYGQGALTSATSKRGGFW